MLALIEVEALEVAAVQVGQAVVLPVEHVAGDGTLGNEQAGREGEAVGQMVELHRVFLIFRTYKVGRPCGEPQGWTGRWVGRGVRLSSAGCPL
ncbi:hypothetical protein D3C84_978610 [compost metagenome]